MKKILSLLVLLVTTVTAMATDYVADCVVSCNNQESTMSGATMSVDVNGDGTYNVTLKSLKSSALGMDFGDFKLSNLSGTTQGGVTTISVEDVNGKFTSGDYTSAPESPIKSFVCKFNADKLYAEYGSGSYLKLNSWQRTSFRATFGTDEGFEGGGSTGGGETGGEDKPAIVDVVEADYAPNGAAFGFPFTINWQTQKLVAKLDLSTCSRYTHNEGIITVGTDNGNGDVSLWNPKSGEANCHLYYTRYYYGTDEKQLNLHYLENPSGKVNRVDNSIQNLEPGLVVFTFDKNGLHVGDNLIATPDQMSTLYNSTSLIFGSKEGSTRSNATYKYVKVVPADWTETTEPTEPEVTVVATKKFDAIDYSNTWSQAGTANVTFEEMSDETVKMKFATDGINISANALTKGTDAKNRTTYTGEAVNDAMSTLTYTIKAVVYTEGTEEKLYMTMEANSGVTFTVGTDPDYVAPEPPAGESTIVENWKSTEGTSWSHDVTIDWNTQKLVVSVNLADTGSDKGFLGVTKKGNTPNWNNDGIIFYNVDGTTIQGYAPGQPNNANTNYVPKGEDPVRFEISKENGVKCQGNVVISADLIAHLTNQSNIVVGAADKVAGALYNYIKVVSLDWKETTEPEVTEVSNKTYTSNLRILDGETTVVEEAEANVNIVKYSDESYKVTLKNVNMLNKTQDLVFVGTAIVEEGPAEGAQPLTIMAKSDEATTTVFGEQVSGTFEITEVSADEIKMGFSMESQNFSYQGEFNYTEEEVEEPEVYTSNLHIYDAAAPETDLFQADQAKVEFLATATGGFKLTLKDVTLNEKTQDLVFTGTLPTPQPGGQEPLAEEGEGEVTPAEPAMILNATADEATTNFFGGGATYATAVFNVSYDKNDNFMMTFTIAAAKNYAGEFNYVKKNPETPDVTVEVEKTFTDSFSLNNVSLGNAKVTIKEMSDKTINMVFTFGTNDFTSTDLVKGTDDKNRTTYTGTISIGGVECVVNGVVYTKDNAEKLYMTLVSTTSGTYVFGTEPTDTPEPPVVEEYPINFDKDANSTHSSRVLNSFSLQQTGKDKQTKSVKTSKAAYEDHTADEPFTVEAGSELTASFDYTGEWMHSFVYIDFDNDGDFSYKEGQWDQTGTDLVAFSFYSLDSNPKNDASGYNSVGDELTGDARNTYVAPSFKAPAKAGEYRIRFKFDWNCILPGGSSSILSDGGGVWDATLKVVEPVVDGISTINAEVANGETQLFTVNGVKLNKLQKGLNIVRTADGKVKKVLVK